MKKMLMLTAVLLGASQTGFAQEYARVLSATPVMQRVAVPREVCTIEPLAPRRHDRGYSHLHGGESGGYADRVTHVRRCTTQTVHEDRPVAYDVLYTYAGQNYSVRTTTDPGRRIPIQVSPVVAQDRSGRDARRVAESVPQRWGDRRGAVRVVRHEVTPQAILRWQDEFLDRQMR